MDQDLFNLAPSVRDDDEGLFSRDLDGQLVRLDAPTESDYAQAVHLQIDGQPVTVPLAEPLKDAQGNVIVDASGRTTPRYTTIYDAVVKLFINQPGDERSVPVPTLCHQPHIRPVGVCRLCAVQVYGQKRGKRAAERRLLPACQHQVKEGMEVFTMKAPGADGDRVRQSVKVLTELLASDHLKDAPPPAPSAELAPFNELGQLAARVGVTDFRFKREIFTHHNSHAHAPKRPAVDLSSSVFVVDHSACILCDRCSRGCNDVKNNQVIGRGGKGHEAHISFDLDDPMGKSSCVQCGECMISCPTSAITFKPVARVEPKRASETVLPAEELLNEPLLAGIPPKLLLWQKGLALRRNVKKGEVLCRKGEPGNTAFLIRQGRLLVSSDDPEAGKSRHRLPLHGQSQPAANVFRSERGPEDLIVGEMACLSSEPRTAYISALEDGEVWEIRRNVLDRLMRLPAQRQRFERIYRYRSLDIALRNSDLFKSLAPEEYTKCVNFLRSRLSFARVEPGQTLFRQGEWADNLYLVRLGHISVNVGLANGSSNVVYRGPGSVLGEIGLLAISAEDVPSDPAAVESTIASLDKTLTDVFAGGGDPTQLLPAGRRTATCVALDHVELARINRADFLEMVREFPLLRRSLIQMAVSRIANDRDPRPGMREYIAQGIYQAQNLLALDLTKCTRCDECTKACVDQHGTASHGIPVTRLLREGLRLGDYLVASSCRSCKDAYCMIGCPVDAIHRGKHMQIVIEDHCIGCGLCEYNCPYGNIWMVENHHRELPAPDPQNPEIVRMVAQPKAATCDLCDAGGELDHPVPRCVYACPHDAAARMTGEVLLQKVSGR